MARRSKRRGRRNNASHMNTYLIGGIVVAAVVIAGAVALKPAPEEQVAATHRHFSIADYRQDASRLTGNVYRLEGRVENIESLGNDRLVAVSLEDNPLERLPLLVRSGASGRINLTRGDVFIFEVECCTGHTAEQKEVKGVLMVRRVETK